jgi:hypothetical protein
MATNPRTITVTIEGESLIVWIIGQLLLRLEDQNTELEKAKARLGGNWAWISHAFNKAQWAEIETTKKLIEQSLEQMAADPAFCESLAQDVRVALINYKESKKGKA